MLGIRQLLLVGLLDGSRDLLDVGGVLHDLLLLLNVGLGLLELLLGLGDFGIEVDATLDVQEGGRFGGNGVGDAASRACGVGGENLNVLDALAAEGLDRGDLLLNGGERSIVECLDDDWKTVSVIGSNVSDLHQYSPLTSSLRAYSAIKDRAALTQPRTSS